jgi:glucokinase
MPISLGNDVNLGTLGEYWLGSAALADSAVGIFVGTGIGGGIIIDGKLVAGHRGAAAEIGHMLVRKDGPPCGCGSRGCLEALASRTAIERDLREALARGRASILTDLTAGDLSVIRSSVLRRALSEDDQLVKEVVTAAAQTLGDACLQIRHLLDPEVIVLGGGLVEACKFYILPIVQDAIASDPLPGICPGGKAVVSALGDDAVVLGAVALAQQQQGRDPLGRARRKSLGRYPIVSDIRPNRITIGDRTFEEDVYIRADGKVSLRSKARRNGTPMSVHHVDADELRSVCKGRPSILIIGTGHCRTVTLSDDGEQFLRRRGVTYEILPSADAVAAYNTIKGRKAALLHVSC